MKLALGTVQFGLDYGIANSQGKTQIKEVASILNLAKNNNIRTLDTAANYGNSEKVLGNVGVDDFHVITKTVSIKSGVRKVVDSFYQSLEDLNQKKVDGLLIHDVKEVKHSKFDILFNELISLKQQGLVNKVGFSTYTPEQVDFLLDSFEFDLIQIPFNVFDGRLIRGGQIDRLNSHGVEIHARSVFLQGLLLDFKRKHKYFSLWENEFKIYQTMVKESGLSLVEYALCAVLNIKGIDKVLVGVNNSSQLAEIIRASSLDIELSMYEIDDVNLLNPSLWKL